MAIRRRREAEPVEVEPRALTAATAVVDLGEGSSWKTWKFGNRDWQAEAWRLYDIIPELRFLAGRIGDSVAKARLYVTEVDENGEESGETTDAEIARLAAVPLGTGAQRDENLRLAGIDLAVAGEFWTVAEDVARDPVSAVGQWFVVTGAAIKRSGDQISVNRPKHRGGGGRLVLENNRDLLIRCHRSHPNDINQADSFTRSAIPALREIELLTKREFAELDSRLTGAGMMFFPESADLPRAPEDPPGIDGFMALVQRAAAASMTDQTNATAMVPIMAKLPDEMMQYVDAMKPINFWSDLSAEIGDMKDRAILRAARSAEIPHEVLTGIGDQNHWSGWLVSEEGIRWISGYLGLIADALTRGFLQRALIKLGKDPERYAFAFDTSVLAQRPNRLEEATALHDKGLISDEELIRAGAFTVEQMPTAAEKVTQLLRALVLADPSLARDKAVQSALGLPAIAGADLGTDEAPEAVSDDLSGRNGPPELEAEDDVPALTASLNARVRELTAPLNPQAMLNAASKLIVFRALELAGGRLATPAERRGKWAEVPRHELHYHVGAVTPAKAETITAGAWGHVEEAARDLGIRDADNYRRLLSGYVSELLTRGMRHHDDLLFEALRMANRGQGLMRERVSA